MSAAFERFKYSFFEDPKSAQDALDTAALEQLAGEERARAEDMLIPFLPDARGVIGLGVLRSRRAEPQLIKLFEAERQMQLRAAPRGPDREWYGFGLIYLARALWLIDPDPRWPAALVELLAASDEWTERHEAALALAGVRDAAAAAALVKALDDPDSLVRHAAACGLLAIYGVAPEPTTPDAMFIRVMADDAARRQGGKRDILAAIAGRPLLPP